MTRFLFSKITNKQLPAIEENPLRKARYDLVPFLRHERKLQNFFIRGTFQLEFEDEEIDARYRRRCFAKTQKMTWYSMIFGASVAVMIEVTGTASQNATARWILCVPRALVVLAG